MKAVIQRVTGAAVSVAGKEIARIGPGLCVLLGICVSDGAEQAEYLAQKIANLRIFEDKMGKLNRSVRDIGGQLLVVSNFTLCADGKKSGNRPSFTLAARPQEALPLYQLFVQKVGELSGCLVRTGEFGADMHLTIENDGPVTILLDSADKFER